MPTLEATKTSRSDAIGQAVEMQVLQRRFQANPRMFQSMFVAEGLAQLRAAFDAGEIPAELTWKIWDLLLRDDAVGQVMMRFVWDLPLPKKRVFIKAIDTHLRDRYPMFAGLSENWPAGNHIPPYVRPANQRVHDFDLVTQGYLGYLTQGYSQREVDLFVWLEAVRDKHCADRPCELGELLKGKKVGGCPVQIHIPEVMQAIAEGKFDEALRIVEFSNPLPNVTGRVCPQELQCQGVCVHKARPIEIGQLEWFLPQRDKLVNGRDEIMSRYQGRPDPWVAANKPPIAIVGSGPAGLINAFLLANQGFPVTVFEAFHTLGGVLKYGIPEFRLPNELVDDVVDKIEALGGRFVTNFIVGKTATLDDLKAAGFWRIFVGTGAGLPKFMNVPGEHLNGVLSANEFLTRVNLMHGNLDEYDTPLPETAGKEVLVIGGGNTAMDAARTAKRLGGKVTIVYRRTKAEMPARVEELHHALEEGIVVAELRSPAEFFGGDESRGGDPHHVTRAAVDVMQLGEPDASGRRRPERTGEQVEMAADLVIMALGNGSNPIIRDSQPDLAVQDWGAIKVGKEANPNGLPDGRIAGSNARVENPDAPVSHSDAEVTPIASTGVEATGVTMTPTAGFEDGVPTQATNLTGIYSGGDAARGGSTAIKAAGDGQAAAHQMWEDMPTLDPDEVRDWVGRALAYTREAAAPFKILEKRQLSERTWEMKLHAPMVARATLAGQFARFMTHEKGELIPLTVADFDREEGWITIVTQSVGVSSIHLNAMEVGEAFYGIAGPLGMASKMERFNPTTETVCFVAGGVGLAPAFPIVRAHLELGNHVTLICGARNRDLLFWADPDGDVDGTSSERVDVLRRQYPDLLDVVLASDDGSFGVHGTVTVPLESMLRDGREDGRKIVEVTTLGPPIMMKFVSLLTKQYGVPTVASINSIMVDATGMCGACMVPFIDPSTGKMVRKHACVDGPEIDGHCIDWDKFLPRFNQFRPQEAAAMRAANSRSA